MMLLIQANFAKDKDLREEKSKTKFRLCERSSGYGIQLILTKSRKETQGKFFTPLSLRACMWKVLYYQRSVRVCIKTDSLHCFLIIPPPADEVNRRWNLGFIHL